MPGWPCGWLGDAVDSWQRDIANRDVYPSIVDAFYLVGYPVIAVGLWLLHRRGGRRNDRAGLLDSAILTIGVGILSWASLGPPHGEAVRLLAVHRRRQRGLPGR